MRLQRVVGAALFCWMALVPVTKSEAQEKKLPFSTEELQAANSLVRNCKYGDCPSTKKEIVAALLVRCIHSISTIKSVDGKDLAALKMLSPGLFSEFLSNIKDPTLRQTVSQQKLPKPAPWVYHFSVMQLVTRYETTLAQIEQHEPTEDDLVALQKLQKQLNQPEIKRFSPTKTTELSAQVDKLLSRIEEKKQEPVATETEPKPPKENTALVGTETLSSPMGPAALRPRIALTSTSSEPIEKTDKITPIKEPPVTVFKVYTPTATRVTPDISPETPPKEKRSFAEKAPALFLGGATLSGAGALALYTITQTTRVTNNAREYTRIGLECTAMVSVVSAGVSFGVLYVKSNHAKKSEQKK